MLLDQRDDVPCHVKEAEEHLTVASNVVAELESQVMGSATSLVAKTRRGSDLPPTVTRHRRRLTRSNVSRDLPQPQYPALQYTNRESHRSHYRQLAGAVEAPHRTSQDPKRVKPDRLSLDL